MRESLKSVHFIYYVTMPGDRPRRLTALVGKLMRRSLVTYYPSIGLLCYRLTGATPRWKDRVASLRYRIRMRLIAPAAAQRNIVRASRACNAGSALLELEDLDSGFGVFVAPGVEVVLVVLLDEEEEPESGWLGFVGLGETGVDVDVVGPGAGLVGGDEAAGVTGVAATGVDVGVVGVGVEVGLGVGVVLDPPVIVNCGLALPESPSTSGEKAHATNPHAARWIALTWLSELSEEERKNYVRTTM